MNKAEITNEYESYFEILRDYYSFSFFRAIEQKVENDEVKGFIQMFLKNINPTIVYEANKFFVEKGDLDKVNAYYPELGKWVTEQRMLSTKHKLSKSSRASNVTDDMGLDFERFHFDMNVTTFNNCPLSFNFENYYWQVKEDQEKWDRLYNTPSEIVDIYKKAFDEMMDFPNIFEKLDQVAEKIARLIDERLVISRYSYSSYLLFRGKVRLENVDKYIVLYYYRIIKMFSIIESMVDPVSIQVGELSILDTNYFITKYKAVIVEVIGNDLMDSHTEFSEFILDYVNNEITSGNFYSINRKLRNNLHYHKINKLSLEEIKLIQENQNIYFQGILRQFDTAITIDIDESIKGFTQIMIDGQRLGKTREEINHDYTVFYLKHIIMKLFGKFKAAFTKK